VLDVVTHLNRPKVCKLDLFYKEMRAPAGSPFKPFSSHGILYSGHPLALVLAETFEAARYAASLILWALRRSDPEQWLAPERNSFATMHSLIRHFDEHSRDISIDTSIRLDSPMQMWSAAGAKPSSACGCWNRGFSHRAIGLEIE
jgi:hypothetical protein